MDDVLRRARQKERMILTKRGDRERTRMSAYTNIENGLEGVLVAVLAVTVPEDR